LGFTIYNSGIRRFVVGAAVISFVVLNSFSKIDFAKPKYKTINDTAFEMGDNVIIPKILYQFDKPAVLKNGNYNGMDSLRIISYFLRDHHNFVVEIGNHTDKSCDYCDSKLTQARAQACVDSLIKLGIEPKRLMAKGYGEAEPFTLYQDVILPSGTVVKAGTILTDKFISLTAPDEKSDDHQFLLQMNRRTELRILATNFPPILPK
jgi:outer membrane protein OmpA-like peptidoglycan-associated protein